MHRNAPLTPEGRLRLCRLIEDGWTVASAGCSPSGFPARRPTSGGGRYQERRESRAWRIAPVVRGAARPDPDQARTPSRGTAAAPPASTAARLADRAGVPASTLHQIWARNGVSRLSDLERRTGRLVRRIETLPARTSSSPST